MVQIFMNQTLHKGHLNGYLLHRRCVFKALCLAILANFPRPTFIPCPTSIPESRVVQPSVWFYLSLSALYKTIQTWAYEQMKVR